MKNISFSHSGRLGDIVYSLALVKRMAEISGEPVDYYVISDVQSNLGLDVFHPSGETMVNEKLFNFIAPLLRTQPYLRKVNFVSKREVPINAIDLDGFKRSGLNLKGGIIQGWYRKTFGISFPLEKAWLSLPDNMTIRKQAQPAFNIIISRTTRFCNTAINYNFLDSIPNVGFIGLPLEFEDFTKRNLLKKLQYVPVQDAKEMARMMSDCKLYIGNQSLNFAIAEGFKITRALEAFEPAPVASPVGGECHEYINSKGLCGFVETCLKVSIAADADRDGDYCDSIIHRDGYKPSIKFKLKKIFGKKRKY